MPVEGYREKSQRHKAGACNLMEHVLSIETYILLYGNQLQKMYPIPGTRLKARRLRLRWDGCGFT